MATEVCGDATNAKILLVVEGTTVRRAEREWRTKNDNRHLGRVSQQVGNERRCDMTLWCIVLTIGFIVQGAYIRSLEKEIEAIKSKSWYSFCEIMKMRIPKNDMKGEKE